VDLFALHPSVHRGPADSDFLDGEMDGHEPGFFLAVLTEKVRAEQRM
jgi:hypothetical protein